MEINCVTGEDKPVRGALAAGRGLVYSSASFVPAVQGRVGGAHGLTSCLAPAKSSAR